MPATLTQQQPVQSAPRDFMLRKQSRFGATSAPGVNTKLAVGSQAALHAPQALIASAVPNPVRPARHALRAGSILGQETSCATASRLDHTTAAATTKSFSVKLGSDAVVLLLVAMPVVRVSMLQALVPFSVWIAYQASTKMILEEANALTARAVGFQ